jgi:hypothetical protein
MRAAGPKSVCLRYAALLDRARSAYGIALAAQGHKVTLGYLPYAEWQSPINRFDLRRQNAYASESIRAGHPLLETVSFLTTRSMFTRIP